MESGVAKKRATGREKIRTSSLAGRV